MKKIMKHSVCACMLAGMFLLQGCFDLTETPYTDIRTDMFEASSEDLAAMVASGYTPLRWMLGWHGYIDVQEEASDVLITPSRASGWHDGGMYKRFHWHTWDIQQSQLNNVWTYSFRGINRINLVLGQFEEGTLPVPEAELVPLKYELRALRALYYSVLLDSFGNVPIVTTFDDQAAAPLQNSRKEVYDFVISELTGIVDHLSDDASGMYGRMHKWAAYSLLARVYLNAEVYTRVPTGGPVGSGTAQWQACIDMCDKVINSGLFKIEDKYRDVFATENHTSKEIIYAIPYDEIYTSGSNNDFGFHMKTLITEHRLVFNMTASPWGGISANPLFIDTYDPDDQRHDDTWLYGPMVHSVTGEQIKNTGGDPVFIRKEMPQITMCEFYDGYRVGKYEIKLGARASLSNDFPYFRYAEILMMKAEAILRISNGARADEAAELVSQVRRRSFANTNPAKGTLTGADLLADTKYQYGRYVFPSDPAYLVVNTPEWFNVPVTIDFAGTNQDPVQFGGLYDEWGWEFVAEMHRRMDMIRFGTFQTKTWYNHDPSDLTNALNIGNDIIIFPLQRTPLSNNINLRQNPGYPDIARD